MTTDPMPIGPGGTGPGSADPFPAPLEDLLTALRNGVLTTLKKDGRPQLSNVTYAYDPAARTAVVSVTDDRAKTRNLRRDRRASLYATSADFWSYVVAEADAELLPVAAAPDDPTADALVAYYRAIRGEHPDWDEYRRAMVEQRRLVLRLHVTRVYGQPPQPR